MTDLAVVAARLTRAADKLDLLLLAAGSLGSGRWYTDDGNVWPGNGDRLDMEDTAAADYLAALAPVTVAALVPLLRNAAGDVEIALRTAKVSHADLILDPQAKHLAAFAARLLREEDAP